MPLMIYGANVPIEEDIDINSFVDIIDDESWKEFMPTGVSKRYLPSSLSIMTETYLLRQVSVSEGLRQPPTGKHRQDVLFK